MTSLETFYEDNDDGTVTFEPLCCSFKHIQGLQPGRHIGQGLQLCCRRGRPSLAREDLRPLVVGHPCQAAEFLVATEC
ncbi:hypothetical protein KVR01_001245 [Diaporthe batatas]|uniref:uncharacterized protein n=1 Tax=Diaporthe batatas TaxID=748121 RepID=UPI001D054276|nr:uncharacterized protein KVR01_001245 [Diaporthe batatas]KAG8168496.1 hypothetical protein KVR01_001245 [Diaporthe batatas]